MSSDRSILIRTGGAGWSAPEASAYDNEEHLQDLIVEQPWWIPGVEREALVVKELPTVAGPIDVCVVGRDGAITVVECKLSSNSERRRMVVGQVVDYASAIWSEGPDVFIDLWARRAGLSLEEELAADAFDVMRRNITEARIDLCLAVDAIDPPLKRLVEFLNASTRSDVRVTALQLSYARHGDVEILIPSTFGGEIADVKGRTDEQRWTRDGFVESLASEEDRASAARIFDLVDGLVDRRGSYEPMWFGQRPRGGIYLQLFGLEFPPAWISVNARRELTICGTCKSYPSIARHASYAALAAALGQSHLGAAKGVRLSSLDLSDLWPLLCDCALRINSAVEDPTDGTSGTCRDEVLAAFDRLEQREGRVAFKPAEIVREMQLAGTDYAESTIKTHVRSRLCVNAPDHHGTTYDDLERVGPDEYRRLVAK